MKIYGPYKRKDGRKHIIIISDDGKRTTVSYPRYVFETYYGVKLKEEDTIDHIDGDFTNDSIDNLQILSRADNIRKSSKPREMFNFSCSECEINSEVPMRQYKSNQLHYKQKGPFCSRECAGRHNQRMRP